MRLPSPILPILDPQAVGDALTEALEALARGGARWIEYRDKDSDERLFRARAAEIVGLAVSLGVDVLINDNVDVARDTGAAGVHLGQDDVPAATARRILGPGAMIGVSVDTTAEARRVAATPVDYVAIGPIFPTRSKPDAGPVVGLEGLREAADATDKPLVAVGGIDDANAASVIAAGADCVAAISVFFTGDVVENTRRMLEAVQRPDIVLPR